MRTLNRRTLVAVAVFLMASCAYAQNFDPPAYLNPSLPPEQRAADLVHRMTVEEKVTQLTNQSRAIGKLRGAAAGDAVQRFAPPVVRGYVQPLVAGKPLYPFGYGLSYTTFSYRGLRLPKRAINAGDPLVAEVTVANTGMREGDEVVQLYLTFPEVPGAPLRALRGFKRVHLKPGESQNVRFELKDRDLGMVTEAGEPIIAEGKYSLSISGGQLATGAPAVSGMFQVKGTKTLPE